jgi:hypothetical protein
VDRPATSCSGNVQTRREHHAHCSQREAEKVRSSPTVFRGFTSYVARMPKLAMPPRQRSGREQEKAENKNRRVGLAYVGPAYHVVLPVNRDTASFRGINGCNPAKTRAPAIYSTVSPPLG